VFPFFLRLFCFRYNLSQKRLQRSCFFYGLFRFCLTVLRITRNPTQSTTEVRKPDSTHKSTQPKLDSHPPATQNSVLLLKITLLLFIYFFLHFLLFPHSHPVSIFICLLRLLSFNGACSLVMSVFVIVAPVVVSD